MVAGRRAGVELLFLLVLCTTAAYPDPNVVLFSLPESEVNRQLEEDRIWQYPHRARIYLNGPWDVRDPATDQVVGEAHIPCSWQSDQHFLFEKKFRVPPGAGRWRTLVIPRMRGRLIIRLNGEAIYDADHVYLPIELPLARERLNPENTLQLEILPVSWRDGALPEFHPVNTPQLQFGIFSGIYIETGAASHIHDIALTREHGDSSDFLAGTITLRGGPYNLETYRLSLSLHDGEGSLPLLTMDSLSTTVEIPLTRISRLRWSPLQRRRMYVEAVLDSAGSEKDRIRIPLSSRSVAAQERKLVLNGDAFPVRGVNLVYQTPHGSPLFEEGRVRKDLQEILRRGFNCVRVLSPPLDEAFYRICDELGLLCLQDLPLHYAELEPELAAETLKIWDRHLGRVAALAGKYNCIVGVGIGAQVNLYSEPIRRYLAQFAARADHLIPVPIYISTSVAGADLPEEVDFQIVELLHRAGRLEASKMLEAVAGAPRAVPCVSGQPYTYRTGRTILIKSTRQLSIIRDLISSGDVAEPSIRVLGQLHDYLLQLPSLGAGIDGDLYKNAIAYNTLERETRLSTGEDIPPLHNERAVISEEKASHSYIYIIVGILNLFVFMISWRRYRLFRQNLGYSIRKPHGFFVNLQERIIIPYRQSFFLLLAITLNGALVYSSVLYFFRDNLAMDYLLSLFISNPGAKAFAIELIWRQPQFLLFATLAIICVFYLIALMMKFLSIFSSARVLFGQALAATIWAAAPFALLLPLGIIVYNILLNVDSVWALLAVLLVFHGWVYIRWINGARVLLDALYFRTFLVVSGLMLITAGAGAYLYNSYFSVWEHLHYLYAIVAYSG